VYRYRIAVDVPESVAKSLIKKRNISTYRSSELPPVRMSGHGKKIIIIGSGPAGLFCGLRLIEGGYSVEILERGKPVQERIKDIERLERDGSLNEESNVLFGEGGAGTYSDGKLTTRVNRPETDWLFKKLTGFGAPPSILYDSKPHLGTDRLADILKNIRTYIEQKESQVLFNTKAKEFLIGNKAIHGIVTEDGRDLESTKVVLACGHSARDMYTMLNRQGIAIEKKGFAVGIRIEHPAELIRSIQYGKSKYRDILPAADYRLAYNNRSSGRGIYTFCMCPGGRVINSSTEQGRLCTNGMSFSGRDLPHSNAAIVVTIGANDLDGHVLAGIDFQRRMEEKAFSAGGGGYRAPAQSMSAFLKDSIDDKLPEVSYRPGVIPSNVREFLPDFIVSELEPAFKYFDSRMKGFISPDSILIGVETRSSTPVRITRDEGYESTSARGLYPIGEGSGYSGGIVSSAVDGIRAADIILSRI
jgi:uncharacterized FAD-dependent dehydrogenase